MARRKQIKKITKRKIHIAKKAQLPNNFRYLSERELKLVKMVDRENFNIFQQISMEGNSDLKKEIMIKFKNAQKGNIQRIQNTEEAEFTSDESVSSLQGSQESVINEGGQINTQPDQQIEDLNNQFNKFTIDDQEQNFQRGKNKTSRVQLKIFLAIYKDVKRLKREDIVHKLKQVFQRKLSGLIIFQENKKINLNTFYVYIELSHLYDKRHQEELKIEGYIPDIGKIKGSCHNEIFEDFFKKDKNPFVQGIDFDQAIQFYESEKTKTDYQLQILEYLNQHKCMKTLRGKQFILNYKKIELTRQQIFDELMSIEKKNVEIIAVGFDINKQKAKCFISLYKKLLTGNARYFDIFNKDGVYQNTEESIEQNLLNVLDFDSKALIDGVNTELIKDLLIQSQQKILLPKILRYYINENRSLKLQMNYKFHKRNFYIWSPKSYVFGKTTFCQQSVLQNFTSLYNQHSRFQDQIKPNTKILLIDNFEPIGFHFIKNICDGYHWFKKSDNTQFQLSNIILIILADYSPQEAFGQQNLDSFSRKFEEINLVLEQTKPFDLEEDKVKFYTNVQTSELISLDREDKLQSQGKSSRQSSLINETYSLSSQKSYSEDFTINRKIASNLQYESDQCNDMKKQKRK